MGLSNKTPEHNLISKTIFFQEYGILAIGDLHLGYESMLLQQGIVLPFNQLENTKKEISEIIKKILSKTKKNKIKKIILLGDINHYFGFNLSETLEIKKFLVFLERFVASPKDIILIKGNHDVIRIFKKNYLDYYLTKDENIAFIHGDKEFPEITKNKKIKTIVMAHIHPAVLLRDLVGGIKKEKFKVFLIGKWKKKQLIIVPSFFPLIEGSEINEFYDFPLKGSGKSGRQFAIVSKKDLRNFRVFVVSDNLNDKENKVYEFGRFNEF
ncbi:metallophosphoesterase [Candidatus Pacearchaeota archaeon]|nr:metallophosphoesterase [Candidatus Pacearchaeota archaeon]